MTTQENFTEKLLKAFAEFMESAGFVKVNGEWVCADDLKADGR